MSFPRYERYKDSEVEWLGEVPEHWEVKRLKYNLRLLTEKTDRRENPIALENIESWSGNFIQTETIFEGEGIAFERGDILFGKLRPYLAKAYLAETPGEAVGDFHVMRPTKNTVGRFAQYQILNREFIAIVDGSTFGAKMPRASWDFMCGMVLTVPPIPEQQTIVAFLDCETAKIDALIAEQQRLIELLKEKRQAVISHAVTKGLNPNAPMKDSGIEWLGEVPENWEIRRLRFAAQLNPSKGEVAELDRETEVSFLPMEAVGDDGSLNLDRIRAIGDVETGYTYFREGDVTIAKITPCFENGKGAIMCGLLGGIGFGTTELIVARPIPSKTTSSYLHWLFTSTPFRKRGEASMYGAGGQKRVPDDFVRNFAIGFPSIQEQSVITAFLEREIAKLDALIQEAKNAITLLRERRTALISAAVTGKIDVRGLVEAQPEREAAA